VEQAQAATPWQEWAKRANDAGFAIKMRYRGEERTTELPLTQDMIGQLAFEAAFRNMTIGELIGQLIAAVGDKDLLQRVLQKSSLSAVSVIWLSAVESNALTLSTSVCLIV
jgi:hypothetical protein